MRLPKAVTRLVEELEKLPGIGPKTAQRLTFYLLHVPQIELDKFSEAVGGLKRNTKICSLCFNVDEVDPCSICEDGSRNKDQICVVEEPLDIVALEASGAYKGLYHVLHGAISPLNNIGPNELHLRELLPRVKNGKIHEIILATNPTMEGEATAMYLKKLLEKIKLKLTRIGRGLPVGGDMQYADSVTLVNALKGRGEF